MVEKESAETTSIKKKVPYRYCHLGGASPDRRNRQWQPTTMLSSFPDPFLCFGNLKGSYKVGNGGWFDLKCWFIVEGPEKTRLLLRYLSLSLPLSGDGFSIISPIRATFSHLYNQPGQENDTVSSLNLILQKIYNKLQFKSIFILSGIWEWLLMTLN